MSSILKTICVCASSLMIFACSQDGAQAQSTSAPVLDRQIQANWDVDKNTSTLGFTGSQNGEEFSGSFKNFEALIKFAADDLENAHIIVTIDTASIDAGDSERNDALPGKEWLAIKSFPSAKFESITIKKTGDNQYEAIGSLTIRDVKRPLTLPFSLDIDGGVAQATAQTVLNRTDFGVGSGMWKSEDWVAHQVQIDIEIHALKATK